MATHSSVLAWRIPGTGEPGGPLSIGSHRVGHDWSDLAAAAAGLHINISRGEKIQLAFTYETENISIHIWDRKKRGIGQRDE